eukprot:CAMPEP_0184644180 /NCGR_PEP_ID=MMETSP0308-20130426/945_1 /TAXON_ID=38269 /ORGANISM="Gloeochaete witrockiana, Strain SAG 46.84" /LENGTH=66 /DNA_ID=CAMNT_0027072573 /DNA_START=79 /DNA_END=279 /DNA_ORIENTATION=+
MPVTKDPFIEEWASLRENTHKTFKITRGNALVGLLVGVVIPVALYYQIKTEQIEQDKRAGRERKYL